MMKLSSFLIYRWLRGGTWYHGHIDEYPLIHAWMSREMLDKLNARYRAAHPNAPDLWVIDDEEIW